MSCPGCDNSSTTYTRCNPPVSTNCVFYQGETLTCKYDTSFQICKGDNLNNVQETIFGKICDITNEINVSSLDIKFPCDSNKNPTKINLLLKDVANATCVNTTAISDLKSGLLTVNPLVTKPCLPCCPSSACPTTPSGVLLSDALEILAECICNIGTTVKGTAQDVGALQASSKSLSDQIDTWSELLSDYNKFKANVLCRLANLENKTNGMACDPPCQTPSTYP